MERKFSAMILCLLAASIPLTGTCLHARFSHFFSGTYLSLVPKELLANVCHPKIRLLGSGPENLA